MYNGWYNYQTWNVSLWLNNEEAWYQSMRFFMLENPEGTYSDLIDVLQSEQIIEQVTPDGVSWTDPTLDREALDEMLKEHLIEVLEFEVRR